jgi:hypothetical protein
MRRARVNFEIVPDEELIPIEVVDPESLRQVDMSETIETFNSERDSNLHIVSEILGIPPRAFENAQHDLETASADFRSQFLSSLYTAQTQEEVEAILNTTETIQAREEFNRNFASSIMGFEGTATIEPVSIADGIIQIPLSDNPGVFVGFDEVDGGFIPPSPIPYNIPTAFEIGAVRSSDLALPEELVEDEYEDVSLIPFEEEVEISQELSPELMQMLEEAVIDAHREIPPNSGTLLISESTSRFSGAIWFEAIKTKTVMLAGLGGINSYTGFLLSRMQPANIILFDDDIVETVNLSGQLYSTQDVGNRKTSALAEMMRNYGSYHGTSAFGRYILTSDTSDIMICGFDNMESRKLYFNKWLNRVNSKQTIEEKKKCLYIDGRLSIEFLQIFCLTGDDEYFINEYKTKHFFSDSEANEVICSLKQTTFMANMIGSLIVNLFVNFVANECEPLIDRDVPFLTEYSAETMFLNTVH